METSKRTTDYPFRVVYSTQEFLAKEVSDESPTDRVKGGFMRLLKMPPTDHAQLHCQTQQQTNSAVFKGWGRHSKSQVLLQDTRAG